MKTPDESLWEHQRSELRSDETGRAFLEFVEDWVETAEYAMNQDSDLAPENAIRAALAPVEQRQGRIAASYVGQMLIVIASHWVYGTEMSERLTSIERRLMEDMLVMKLAELEKAAAEEQEESAMVFDGEMQATE